MFRDTAERFHVEEYSGEQFFVMTAGSGGGLPYLREARERPMPTFSHER